MRGIFESYLQHRFRAAGAVTPRQQLEVVRALRREAQEKGMVPVDEGTVARLDLGDAAVQAVLRGEQVVLSGSGKQAARRSAQAELPTPAKVGILLAIMLLPLALAGVFLARRGERAASPLATATLPAPLVTATPSATPTLSGGVAAEIGGEAPSSARSTETPTPTPDERVVYLPEGNNAASDPTAPASIAIGGMHYVVHEGHVEPKSGVWQPQGVEWLAGTEVRKVIAVPRALLEQAQLVVGDAIYLRYRNGFTATYTLVQVLEDVVVDQIEVLTSSKPSLVIIGYTNDLRSPRRLVAIAEMTYPAPTPIRTTPPPTSTPPPSETPAPPPYTTIGSCNLRAAPTTQAAVVNVLPKGAAVWLVPGVAPVVSAGTTWVYVHTEFGEGWIVFALLVPHP